MSTAIRGALHVNMYDLADAQTRAYGGGWTSSVAKLCETCRVQSIDLEQSAVVYDGRTPAGIALVGRRGTHGWLYDLAVAPQHRHAGMGTRLMRTVLGNLQRAGVTEVELDVAAMRTDAIGLYTRLGFQQHRTYLNLAAKGSELGLDRLTIPEGRTVVAGVDTQLIAAYAQLQAGDPAPCWDRSLPSLLSYPDGYISVLADGDETVALMHYLARPATGADPDRIRPLFVSLAPGAGTVQLAELLASTAQAAFGNVRDIAFRVALEPEGSRFAALLDELGMPVVAESYDMRLAL